MPVLRLAVALFACLMVWLPDAAAWDRGSVERFATLPPGALNPEGITVDRRNGDVYVTGFDPSNTHQAQIYVFDQFGQLKRVLNVTNSSAALLGIAFHPRTGDLLVADLGANQVVEVNPQTGAGRQFTSVPGAGPNALAFDDDGNVYVSGSFSGAIYRTTQDGGANTVWVQSPLLATTGFPPFGANGIDFNRHETALFVANTGNDTIVRVPKDPVTGAAGTPEVFTNSINGADGLLLDEHDNVWVCANQADEIVVTDPTGKAIAKLGDFDGVKHGSPDGFLFPASLVRHQGYVYVTNLSLDLRNVVGQQSVDSQWAAQVTRQTISRIRAQIPQSP